MKRAVQLVPLLVALGITTGVGTGLAGMGISISKFAKLSKELIGISQRNLTTDRLSTGQDRLPGCSGPAKPVWPGPPHSCTRRHLCPAGRTLVFSPINQDWFKTEHDDSGTRQTASYKRTPTTPCHLPTMVTPFSYPPFF
jgi:hypothetical protein